MKNYNLPSILMLVLSAFLFVQCTSDFEIPDPIAGPPGLDGVDGIDGVDGVTSCVTCHSDTARDAIAASFALSGHATGSTFARGSRANCAQCHGNEGYIDYVTTGAVRPFSLELIFAQGDSIVYDTVAPYPDVSPIGCATCHDMHDTFDFENDGPDFALRNTDAVTLVIDETTEIDFGGSSNNCVTCHQPRNSYEIPGGTGEYTITSQRFGPHYGAQSTMLEGIMGGNVAGSVAYPGVGSAAHRTGTSCVECHMGPSTTAEDGQHTWIPTAEACVACHPNGVANEIGTWAVDFATLEDLLIARNFITPSGSVLGGDGLTNASSSNPLVVPVREAQAIWNYRTLLQDNSRGVHNPAYSNALLKNSIEALQD